MNVPIAADSRWGSEFRILAALKHEQCVTTLLGESAAGRRVIIKTAPAAAVAPAAQLRLEREVGLLRDADTAMLAVPLQAGREGEEFYVVRDHVEGVTLDERLREGPLSVRETIEVGRGVIGGLREAHERAVLHRDVKPSNVIVDASGPRPRAVLVDLGFARGNGNGHGNGNGNANATGHAAASTGSDAEAIRAAHHVSLEQAGLLHQDVDERSDLYSAGVLLFECLAGRPPFTGTSVGEVLRGHATSPVPSLRTLGVTLPTALDELVGRLLRKDPEDRYQSAAAVWDDLWAIGNALDRGDEDPVLVLGLHERRRRSLTEPALIARTAEVRRLQAALERAVAGSPSLVLLEAGSGGGKSRLLAELERISAQSGAWALRGHGRDQTAQRPFEVLEGVVQGIVSRCASEPAFAGTLRRRLAGRESALVEAMPELRGVLDADRLAGDTPVAAEQHGAVRTIQALAELLGALGAAGAPAVVMLDDCQWADGLTSRLLAHWSDSRGATPAHIVVVVAFRSEEVTAAHPLRALAATDRIVLDPLSSASIRDLVESMAGTVPDEPLELIVRLAEGSPFMAAELLRGLVDGGALVGTEDGWRVVGDRLASVQASDRSAALFSRRLEQAPQPLVHLLSVAAVLGKQFDLAQATELAGYTPARALALLVEARRRHIVWAEGDGRFAFAHDKLREALLARLPRERRRSLHALVATSLERRDADRDFELAYHFDAAGEHARALPYALRAAATARARYALDAAQRQYEIAARGAADPALQREIAESLGDIAMLAGRYDEAREHFVAARARCDADELAAGIESKLGELAFKRGDVRESCETLVHALRLLGQRVPGNRLSFVVMLLGQVLVQAAHCLLARRLVGRRPADNIERERLIMRLHSELAHAYWFSAGLVPCAWTHLRGMNLAERYGPTPELAQAYSEHAPVMTMLPWFSRGIDYSQRSLAIRRERRDTWGEGQSLHFYGVVLYGAGRYEECLEKCRAAMDILERTGDWWEMNTAGWHVALALYRLGRMEEAVAAAQAVHRAGLDLGDVQASGISVGAWAKASGGAVPPELLDAELARAADDVHARVEVLQAQALRLIGEERIDEAVAVLEDADAYLRRSGLRQEYVAPLRPWLATALRMQVQRASELAPAQRRRRLRRARRAARRAVRLSRSFRNNLPHALREAALLAAMSGHRRRAARLLDRSLAVAIAQGARHERALTLLARGEIAAAAGTPGAGDDLATSRRMLAELQIAPPADLAASAASPTLSLADRFATVLDAGRCIAAAVTEEAVLAAACDAAVTLLRGECSVIVALDDDHREDGARDGVCARAGDVAAAPSRAVIERTVRVAQPVVLGAEDLADEGSPHPGPGALRSALCAPIFVRGRATALLYVTHRQLSHLFGEEEQRLAAFVTTLAGAALEAAEGFAAVRSLSASLEERVARRTAELSASKHRVEEALAVLASTLDSTADGILVVDHAGRNVTHNRRFAEMWGMPDELLEAGEDSAAVRFAAERVRDPERFMAKVREVYASPEASSHDEIVLRDGRVFERDSKPHRLGGESAGRVWSFRDITRQKRFEQDLQRLADHDPLTGLLNRRRFAEELERSVAHVARHGGDLAALVLDIDNFKQVNDTLGHKAGDELIQSVAVLLSDRRRATDVLARLGGDEFALLLPQIDDAGAAAAAESVRDALEGHVVVVGDRRVAVTVSIGVALLGTPAGDAVPATAGEQLMVAGDLAMYEAKADGGNRVALYTASGGRRARGYS